MPWLTALDDLFDVSALLLGLGSALHALLWKRDPRSALGWISVCLLFPLAGALLYWLFGVNRIKTRGRKLRQRFAPRRAEGDGRPPRDPPALGGDLGKLLAVAQAVTHRPLVSGNRLELLHDGEQAYPAMRAAIDGATTSVHLCTYIFDTDGEGRAFADALAAAVARGVDVKVLVDGIGEKYSWPRASRLLRARGVPVVRFLPPSLLRPNLHMNLRNHRKLLVVDGRLGFTGGMNIGDRHLAARADNPRRVVDLHFRVQGPLVAQLEDVFLEDWAFVTDRPATDPPGSEPPPAGTAVCRAIADGPDEDLDKLSWILQAAIGAAHRRIVIMTPYFVPDRTLVAAFVGAALRGVDVQILLPGQNNLPIVHWATRHMLWELLEAGVRVWYQPPPFVHSKFMIVDETWARIGSANLDPRSLRLNFELDVEVWDAAFVAQLARHAEQARAASRPVTQAEVDGRPLGIRIRDGLARLASPML